jgi:hypothetical protein
MALELETFQQRFGANSFRHRVALINLERYMCGSRFIAVHGKPESKLVHSYTHHGSLRVDAAFALNVGRYYTNFLNSEMSRTMDRAIEKLLTPVPTGGTIASTSASKN